MSDIHGNSTALDAVLADASGFDVDSWWVLGDVVALGPNPVAVIESICSLREVTVIAGNTERYLVRGERPYPSLAEARADPSLIERLVEVAESFAWTRGAITAAGHFDWLSSLVSDVSMTLQDGTRVLGIHASPRSDDGPGIDTLVCDEDLAALLAGCDADVVIGGHTHDMTDRVVGGIRAVNLGSIGNSHRVDSCATYALLHFDGDGHHLEQRVVDYDHGLELAALDRVHHPGAPYIRSFHEP